MASVAFNTYEFIKSLTDAGIEEQQAAAISAGILRAHETADLATKGDLRKLQAQMEVKIDKMDAKIDKMELRIDRKLAEMRGESILVRWMLGLIMAGIAGLIIKTFFGT